MRESIHSLLSKYDGLVMGGNDFLYTKELPSHPCSYFLYQYGDIQILHVFWNYILVHSNSKHFIAR